MHVAFWKYFCCKVVGVHIYFWKKLWNSNSPDAYTVSRIAPKSIQSPSNLAAAICKGVSLVPQKTAVADPHWMYPCLGHRGRREGECGGSTGSLVWGANFLAIFTAFSSVDVGNSFWLKMTGAYQKLAAGNSNILLFSSRKMGEMIQIYDHIVQDGLVQPPN